jgi:NitT/TauT family transport system substrate-binding protein
MRTRDQHQFTRRHFIAGASALGAASALGIPSPASADPPPETRKLRLYRYPAVCIAPQYIAEVLLRAEGFHELEYVDGPENDPGPFVGPGKADLDADTVTGILTYLNAGVPIVTLAGMHLGCYELFGSTSVRSVRDLKGKSVPVDGIGGAKHLLLSSMVAYVGLDPRKDVEWAVLPHEESMRLFEQGKLDAFLGYPPEPQELRAKKVGRVILNTATDKPWSQYYCCMVLTHREFAQKNPIATKRALRAMLKAADLCVQDPEWAARQMVDKGFAQNYAHALETLREVRYDVWRSYNPEDTLRFHALRLHDAGMLGSTPHRLIAQGTDWRFLNELKKELKA